MAVGRGVSGDAGTSRLRAGVPSIGSRWTPRVLLLGPALMQLAVASLLSRELRGGIRAAAVLVPVILLALGGAAGLAAGMFRSSGKALHLGILSSLLGFALAAVIPGASTLADTHTSVVPGIGELDAEGLGTLMLIRVLVELPFFWVLYSLIASVAYVGSRETERRTMVAPHSPSPRRPR
jgi:hypothetical protein